MSKKKQELLETVMTEIPSQPGLEKIATYVIERFSQVTEPPGENRIEMIVLGASSGLGGGRSKKAGNILLNWRKLFSDIPENLLTVVGAATSNYLIPFAALVVWIKVLGLSKLDITESHAMVIAALWDMKDKDNRVEGFGLLTKINKHIQKFTMREFMQKELDQILGDLSQMKAVELTSEGKIWLREWVRKPYY